MDDAFVDTANCLHSGQYGLKLTYAMTGLGNGGWGVRWDQSPEGHFDASDFSFFEFWVKGASGGETFQIGLKDTNEIEVKVESTDLTVVSASEWRKVVVGLSKFSGVNTAIVENVNFGFNANHDQGTLCMDDMAFK